MFISEKIKLNNGLSLWQAYLPNTHSISIGLFVKAGVQYENIVGISHLLEHLHFRELNNMKQDELYYLMESLGTTLRAETYRDFIYFYMKILPKNFEKSLDIWSGILQTFEWSESSFKKEKEVVLRQIEERSDFDIDIISRNNYMGNIALSNQIMGDMDIIQKITCKDISKFKKVFFCSKYGYVCFGQFR